MTLLAAEESALQAQADALTAADAAVPDAITDALQGASDRTAGVTQLMGRVSTFHTRLLEARNAQQGCEGELRVAATAPEAQRARIARQLFRNFALILGHFCDPASPAPDPQFAAADLFDLATLKRPKSKDEPEDPDPAPAPRPPRDEPRPAGPVARGFCEAEELTPGASAERGSPVLPRPTDGLPRRPPHSFPLILR